MYQYSPVGATPAATSMPSSPVKLLPRIVDWTWPANDRELTTLSHHTSRFGSPSMRTTAQAAGILVVDDDPQIRALVTGILVLRGYLVWRATNGFEALRVLDHARPALALLDMRMPDMDGWEFAQALDERCLRLPMLVMTAGTHGRRWAEEIGAVGCVTKPFELKYLVAEVERLAPT
jgi:CheY-like chemotaxis protein